MSKVKEVRFFQDPRCLERLEEYATFFDGSKAIRGESTPFYANHPIAPGVPERIQAAIPDVKLLYLVRDPVERTISSHIERLAAFRSARTVKAHVSSLSEDLGDLADPYNGYIANSLYATQLDRYLEFFPREQLLVIDQADLLSHRRGTLRRVFEFIGVNKDFWSPRYEEVYNPSESKLRWSPMGRRLADTLAHGRSADAARSLIPGRVRKALVAPMRRVATKRLEVGDLDETLRERLREVFRDDVERLRVLTGNEFATWQI